MRGQIRYRRPFWEYLVVCAGIFHRGQRVTIDPDLFQERARPGGQPLKLRYYALLLPPIVHWCIAGLDVGRFHWSDSVPPALQIVGLAIFALAIALIIWAMRINRFFSSVIRLQEDRGHELVTDGPYRWVRHPGYIAAILVLPRERNRAGVVAVDAACDGVRSIAAAPHRRRRSLSERQSQRIFGLRGRGALPVGARNLVGPDSFAGGSEQS